MADQLQLRGGTTSEHSTFTGALREVTVDTDKDTLIVHDAATAGGHPLLREDGSNSALALGSQGTPSLKFTGDANTGIYSPGADQVAISTNGTGRLFIDSAGNVGVGGTPNAQLNLIAGVPTLRWTDSDTSGYSQILQSDTSLYIDTDRGAAGTGSLIFRTNGTNERLRITSDGKVGVGNSSPVADLDIAPAASSATLRVQARSNTSPVPAIELMRGTGTTFGQDIYADYRIKNDNAQLVFEYAASGTTTERMRIDSSGNVGIGTTTVQAPLHIGTASAWMDIGASAGNRAKLGYDSNNLYFGSSSSTGQFIFKNNISSTDHPVTSGTELARIDSSGRLLVGTSTSDTQRTASMQIASAGGQSGWGSSAILSEFGTNYNPWIALQRSRNSTIGSHTVVNSGDILGGIQFNGSDGNSFESGASIKCEVDGTPGDGDMPGRLVFSTTADGASSPTERMRIDNLGNTTNFASGIYGLTTKTSLAAGTTNALLAGVHSATSTTTGGTVSFTVYTNGNIVNTNNSYGAISDIKLKENIVDAGSQWDDLKDLRVVNYNFKEGQTHTQIGLIAQEVELVSPGLVSESPDRDAEGNDLGTVTKSVNYSVLYMKAVKALQEAMERIETLEQRLSDAGIA